MSHIFSDEAESRFAFEHILFPRAAIHNDDAYTTTTVDVQRHLWPSLPGTEVAVWRQGRFYRQGLVDDAMADASGFWLAADGCEGREFIGLDSADQVKACLPASAIEP